MTDASWTDRIVGERMRVDREFASRVTGSRFSNQEWSLVMTATAFEIRDAADPDAARLVANTEQVEQILPELENVRAQAGPMGAAGGGAQGDSGSGLGGGAGGLLDSIRGALGVGGGGSGGEGDSYEEERRAAERLTEEYARELQAKLEENGRWESVRRAAAAEHDAGDGTDDQVEEGDEPDESNRAD